MQENMVEIHPDGLTEDSATLCFFTHPSASTHFSPPPPQYCGGGFGMTFHMPVAVTEPPCSHAWWTDAQKDKAFSEYPVHHPTKKYTLSMAIQTMQVRRIIIHMYCNLSPIVNNSACTYVILYISYDNHCTDIYINWIVCTLCRVLPCVWTVLLRVTDNQRQIPCMHEHTWAKKMWFWGR